MSTLWGSWRSMAQGGWEMPVPTSDEKLAWIKLEPPSEAELAAVEALRPGDYEIGFQRTNDILDEALEVFQRSCRSSMGIAGDVMVALFTAGGDLVNAAAGTYLHAIIQPIIVKYIRRHYARNPGIEEGDIWCANDALYGGIHNPDVVCLVPVFHQGELIAWAGAANHTTETGAIEPGGMPVSAQARFEEGMNLPPVKIGQGGELRNDWLEVFSAYGIRAPQMVVTDLKARATAADRVRTRLVELADKEGREWVVGLLRKMLMVAEEGARRRVAAWPEGRFRCVAFSDSLGTRRGLVRSAYLTLEKRGDRLVFDFTGTSPENVSSYHAHVQSTIGHIANYVYSNVFYDLPISSATFAPMEFRIPRGTVLNPDDRAATSNAVMICTGAMSTTPNCFAKLMFSSRSDWQRAVASLANAGNAMVIAGLSQWGLPFADMIAYSINTEIFGRPEEHVDERPDERDHERDERREPDEQRVLDPPSGVLVRPVAEREPEHEREEREAVEDRVLGARADEAGRRHSSILPITKPAAKAEPTAPARTAATRSQIESFSCRLIRELRATLVVIQLREKVQGAGDEHRAVRPCELEGAGARGAGIGLDLDPLEMRRGERGELGGGERAAVAALGRDERRAENRQRLEHHPRPLVAEDRADDRPAARRRDREPRQQPAEAREVVGAVPDLEIGRATC